MDETTLAVNPWLLLPGMGLFLLAVLVGFGRRREEEDFFLAGRRAGSATVFASLLATVLGASGTSGIVALAVNKGWAAFWWLGAGSLGLCFLGLFWAVPMRRNPSTRTLPEWLGQCYGLPARRLAAGLIAVMWTAVIAAQWAAAGALLQCLLGCGAAVGILLSAGAVAAYTAVGGQASVLRTDRWQLPLIGLAIALALWCSTRLPLSGGVASAAAPVPGLFQGITPLSWLALMLVVGGMYVVGPDLCSRMLVAENDRAARRGALGAGLALLPISLAIVAIGVRIHQSGAVFDSPREALPWLITASGTAPPLVAGFIGGGLLAAMLSSADTCLLTAATVIELDLFPTRSSGPPAGRLARRLVPGIALAAAAIALVRPAIIANLLLAYAFYAGGLLLPLLLAGSPRLVSRLARRHVWVAMAIGGVTPVVILQTGLTADLSIAGLGGIALAAIVLAGGFLSRPDP